MKKNPIQVGHRIRDIRTNILGLSMDDFGKKIDDKVRSGTVSNWETGKNLPNNERLKKIAELGNITVDELLYGADSLLTDESLENIFKNNDSLMSLPEAFQYKHAIDMIKTLIKDYQELSEKDVPTKNKVPALLTMRKAIETNFLNIFTEKELNSLDMIFNEIDSNNNQ